MSDPKDEKLKDSPKKPEKLPKVNISRRVVEKLKLAKPVPPLPMDIRSMSPNIPESFLISDLPKPSSIKEDKGSEEGETPEKDEFRLKIFIHRGKSTQIVTQYIR